MKFFSLETCKKLLELGCKSESGFSYFSYDSKGFEWYGPFLEEDVFFHKLPAFSQNDLTGCHEQARENRFKWKVSIKSFNSKCFDRFHFYYKECRLPSSDALAHAMIDAPDAEEYLKETLK